MSEIKTVPGCLVIRLGACLSGPQHRLQEDLAFIAAELNRSRNAMERAYERWHEDHPGWQPEPVISKRTVEQVQLRGTPLVKNQPMPQKVHVEAADGERSWEVLLYHAGRQAAPKVSATLQAQCSKKVAARLKSNVPYDHPGKAHYRWQGILLQELPRDCWRGQIIPMPSNVAVMMYNGVWSSKTRPSEYIQKHGKNGCVLSFPLWSREAGRQFVSPLVRLDAGSLTNGQREVLGKIARSEWPMCDSEIVYHDRGTKGWYLHLVYEQPVLQHNYPKNRVATLQANAASARQPFLISCDEKTWQVGDGNVLLSQSIRYRQRVRVLKARTREMNSGRYGHGRGYFYEKQRPLTDVARNVAKRFRDKLVSEILRFVQRYRCGTICLSLPGNLPWFVGNKLSFARERFEGAVRYQCKKHGIDLVEASGEVVKETPVPARVPEANGTNGHAPKVNGTNESAPRLNGRRSRNGDKTAAAKPRRKARAQRLDGYCGE